MASAKEVDATCLYAVQTVVRYVISYTYTGRNGIYTGKRKKLAGRYERISEEKKNRGWLLHGNVVLIC